MSGRAAQVTARLAELSGASADELASALREFDVRDIAAAVAAGAGEGGEPFNGGTITGNLVVDTAAGPQLQLQGAASGDYDVILDVRAGILGVFEVHSDGTGEWTIREEGSAVEFLQVGGPLAGNIMAIADYGTQFREAAADGGEKIFEISRESGGGIGFFNTAPAAKPTGVAVTAEAIHAALVTLGLIAGP